REWLARADIGQLGAFEVKAGSPEERKGAAEVVAVTPRTVSDRRGPSAIHDVGAHGHRKWLQEFALALTGGNAMRRQIASVEIAGSALIQIEEIIVVDPLGIEQLQDSLAHAHLRKKRPSPVEDQTIHALRESVGHVFLDNLASAQCRELVGHLPTSRIGLDAQIVKTLLECFEVGVAIAVVVEADSVEIPKAAIDRQIAPPIIIVAFER